MDVWLRGGLSDLFRQPGGVVNADGSFWMRGTGEKFKGRGHSQTPQMPSALKSSGASHAPEPAQRLRARLAFRWMMGFMADQRVPLATPCDKYVNSELVCAWAVSMFWNSEFHWFVSLVILFSKLEICVLMVALSWLKSEVRAGKVPFVPMVAVI